MSKKSLQLLRLMLAMVFFAFIVQVVFLFSFPKSTTPSASDLVIVYPGDDNRIKMGFKLAQEIHTPNFAITGIGMKHVTDLAKKYGNQDGINLLSGAKSRSTFEDALVMKQLLKQHQFKSVILVTSDYHMPRAYLISRLVLLGTGVRLQYFTVHEKNRKHSMSTSMAQCKLLSNEIVKLWGSIVELAWYQATGILPRDIVLLNKISSLMRKNIFYCPDTQ